MKKIGDKSEEIGNILFSKGINELSVSQNSDLIKRFERKVLRKEYRAYKEINQNLI